MDLQQKQLSCLTRQRGWTAARRLLGGLLACLLLAALAIGAGGGPKPACATGGQLTQDAGT